MAELGKLSVLTWNVWFGDVEQVTRYETILLICQSLNPDVICLQEVIIEFIEQVKDNAFFMDNYTFSDTNLKGSTIGNYGVMIMVKKSLAVTYSIHRMPSIYDRKLVIAKVSSGNDSFTIGSVHLESLANHPTRETQMEICNQELTQYNHSLLCGDFNFCSHSNYNGARGPLENESLLRIMPEYLDVWSVLRPDELGYTFDTDTNPMIGNKVERMRYDRIVYRSVPSGDNLSGSGNKVWKATKIEIVGTTPIRVSKASPLIVEKDVSKTIWSKLFGNKVNNNTANTTSSSGSSASGYVTPPRIGDIIMVNIRGTSRMAPLLPSDHFGLYAEFEFGDV